MSGTEPVSVPEVERKYVLRPGQSLPPPDGLPATARPPSVDTLTAQYFDTRDLRLLRLGVTLRRREGGPDAGWHLKIPAGTGAGGAPARTEVRLGLAAGTGPPEPLVELLTGVTRREPLVPVAHITTERLRRELVDAGGRPQAEVVEDRVRAVVGGHAGAQRWREIEVEDVVGDGAVADVLSARLAAAGIERSASPSKLHHAVSAADGSALPAPPAQEGVLRGYLRRELEHLVLADVGVRRDVPESVHAMRKASRRLRSALRAYAPVVGLAERADALEDELRWLGHRLSEARDVEVQRARLAARVAAIAAPGHETAPACLEAYFDERGAAAREHVVAALDSERYLGLLGDLEALVGDLAGPDGRDLRRGDVARPLRRLTKKVTGRLRDVEAAPAPAERDAAVHRVRKAAKRLRYAVEVAEPLAPKKAGRALNRLDDLQDLLGEFQDAVVAREHLARAAGQGTTAGATGLTLGVAYQQETGVAEAQVACLGRGWKRALKRVRPLCS
ncbi:CYTH and CHAD domain-containing protein [Georgenia thermotolerans]|uniref:CYTH and CHAD domain-containing protein n=1 Tax=Georgenia thermotolerans TaxID=527326 RepID=UPI001B8B2985|nr:CYTH and CHAD domain-containing protein [Georgenia thermotolerans]